MARVLFGVKSFEFRSILPEKLDRYLNWYFVDRSPPRAELYVGYHVFWFYTDSGELEVWTVDKEDGWAFKNWFVL